MGEIGQDYAKIRGGHQSDSNVIYDGGTVGATVQIKVLSPVYSNGKNGVRGAHRVPAPNHREAGTSDYGRDVGDTVGKVSEESCGNAVGGHLNWPQKGDVGSVGGAATDLLSLCKREGLRGGGGGRAQEGLMAAPDGARNTGQGKLGRDIAGHQKKAQQEGHTVGDGSGDIRGRREGGWRCWDGDRRQPGGRRTPCGGWRC